MSDAQRWHRDWLAFLVAGPLVGRQEFHLELVHLEWGDDRVRLTFLQGRGV